MPKRHPGDVPETFKMHPRDAQEHPKDAKMVIGGFGSLDGIQHALRPEDLADLEFACELS